MRVLVFAHKVPSKIKNLINIKPTDYIIAVDHAFDSLVRQKINVDLVVGDFDSIKNTKKLKRFEQLKLNPIKDETDTKRALEKAYEISKDVILIGGIQGPRIEHFISNMYLFDIFKNLIIIDNNSKLYMLEKGMHRITKGKYINLFSYPEANVTLEGFKYNLDNYNLKLYNALGVSNEVEKSSGIITVNEGRILVIETKKD